MSQRNVDEKTDLPAESFAAFETIEALEHVMVDSGACYYVEPSHAFHDGLYTRTITVPAGSIMTGHRHLDQHVVILSQGEITVWADGEPHRRLTAPCMFTVEAGSRRVGLTHADTVWTTVHITPLTDVEEWERTALAPHAFLPIPLESKALFTHPHPNTLVAEEVVCLP